MVLSNRLITFVSVVGGLLLFIFFFHPSRAPSLAPSLEPSLAPCSTLAIQQPHPEPITVSPVVPVVADEWSTEKYVSGPPGSSLRDNLLESEKYITAFVIGGWSNDVMAYINLIYLSLYASRIPVLPPFYPSEHMAGQLPAQAETGLLTGTPIHFSDVFDLPLLRKSLQRPIIEWKDIKREDSVETDDIGCWSAWINAIPHEGRFRKTIYKFLLHLNITYSAAPITARLDPHDSPFMTFPGLASLSNPSGRQDALNALPERVIPEPDDHLQCFDFLYWLSAHKPHEFEHDWSPAWNIVGTKLKWTKKLEDIAFAHLKRLFGVEQRQPLPPYIAIHVRHNDFAEQCAVAELPLDQCYAPLSAFSRRVKEIQRKLAARGIDIPDRRVVVTSDESRQEWWDDVHALGWVNLDYEKERTEEIHGPWYPLLIDAVVQSRGHGFVGTKRSTMSLLGQRRTQDWQKGETWMVDWGWVGADN